jgi:hypothetical protein
MIMHDELEMMWKEMVMAFLKVLSQNLARRIKENHEKFLG